MASVGSSASRRCGPPGVGRAKGVAVSDVFTMLETDHRTVESLLTDIEASEEGPEREAFVVKVTQALQLHMQFEEGELYPLLQQVDGEMEQEAEVERQLARDGLAK